MKPLFLSVVICTLNRDQPLVDTIRGILAMDYVPFELIIVDRSNQHEPETEAFLSQLASSGALQWVRHPVKNLCVARNVGIRQARGEVVVFVDDDVRFRDTGYLAACASGYAGDDVVGVGGPCPVKDDSDLRPLPPEFWKTGRGWHVRHLERLEDCPELWGCNMSFRKSALERVGGFDENITFRGDETDLCRRIRRLGRIVYEPDMFLYHMILDAGGGRDLSWDYSVQRVAGAAYALLKNRLTPPPQVRSVGLVRYVPPGLRSILWMAREYALALKNTRAGEWLDQKGRSEPSVRDPSRFRFYAGFALGWALGHLRWVRAGCPRFRAVTREPASG